MNIFISYINKNISFNLDYKNIIYVKILNFNLIKIKLIQRKKIVQYKSHLLFYLKNIKFQ